MAGEWEDVPDVNVITLPKPPKSSEWVEVNDRQLPMPKLPLPTVNVTGRGFPDIMGGVKTKLAHDARANTAYLQKVLEQRGPGKFELAYENQNTPWSGVPNKMAVIAGRETAKLGAGAQDLGYFLKYLLGTDSMQENAIQSKMKLRDEQEEGDRLYQEMAENQGISSVGAMLPYMATGALMGPAARKISEQAVKTAGNAITGTAKAGQGAFVRGVNAAAASTGPKMAPVKWAAQKAKNEFVDAMSRAAAQRARQIPMIPKYRVNLMRDILAGGATGAAEGTLHYDRNPIEGAITGLLGMSAGKMVESPFLRAPKYWSPNEQRIVDWMRDQGYIASPGMQTGSRRLQKFEHGIREFDTTADHMGQLDRHNQMIFNRTAAESIGMRNPNGQPFDPRDLSRHIQEMKLDYDNAVSGTTGRLNNRNINNIMQTVDELRLNQSPEAQKAYKIAKAYKDQISAAAPIRRGPNGRFQPATFDGADFQRINGAMREEVKSAMTRGDLATVRALQPLIREFGQGVDRGVLAHGGRTKLAQWKDLNERWAMANLMMDNGLDIMGNVNAKKLGQHLMATDAQRTLTERGGRITNLQRLAKGDHMVRNQAGSGLSGANIINDGQQSFVQRMLQTPVVGQMPILPQLYMNMYLRGIPSTRGIGAFFLPGFQGAKGKGAFTIPQTIRALEQGTQPQANALESISRYLPEPMEEFINTYTGSMR